jgi:serine/threonine protein kinase
MQPSIESLCNQLARCRLLDGNTIRDLRGRWRGQAGAAPDDVAAFRAWLVKDGYASDFQLDMLQRGYGDFLKFGDYTLQDRIGTGRMAGVYKAFHPLGQVVAIKVLPAARAKNPQVLGRFLREARLAVRLDHDNVVRAFQHGTYKDMHYIVMEYLEGETLEEVLRRRQRLPLVEAVPILIQALRGLDYLHDIAVVHRDLKPGNLMLLPGDHAGDSTLHSAVKILDIGLARALFDEGTPLPGEAANITTLGAVVGTLNYMAPEQARGAHGADIRADIYSLGCVLYEMLTGAPPFGDANFARQMQRHAEETPRPLHEVVPGLPPTVDQVVQKMLAKDPALRYPVPSQVLKDLKALALPVSAVTPARPMRSYLTWLESQPKDAPGAEDPVTPDAEPLVPAAGVPAPVNPAPPMAMPMAAPVNSAVPVYDAAPVRNGALASAPAAPPPEPGTFVEAVVTNPALVLAKAVSEHLRAFGWTKRDWIAAGIGAAAVLILQGLVWLARSLF